MARPKKGQLSQKEVIFAALPAAIEKESGGGTRRFSERDLFYGLRPLIIEKCNIPQPTQNTFRGILLDYEKEFGRIKLKYNEPRGRLYHPHTREEIQLGTIAVEEYQRPEWTFNKILYIEKAGSFPTLIDTEWPERWDCALLSSQGQATGAVCDVIDLLADTDEEIKVFCVHDADGYGTCIYQALQDGARARPARKVNVINLGLEAAEAVALGLPWEPVVRKRPGDRVPVARYVPAEWVEWYQTKRIEINTLGAGGFVDWLNRKLTEHDTGKVVPPEHVLRSELEWSVRSNLRSAIEERIGREVQIEKLVETAYRKALSQIQPEIDAAADTVLAHVMNELADEPTDRWDDPISRLARYLAVEPEAA